MRLSATMLNELVYDLSVIIPSVLRLFSDWIGAPFVWANVSLAVEALRSFGGPLPNPPDSEISPAHAKVRRSCMDGKVDSIRRVYWNLRSAYAMPKRVRCFTGAR